MADPGLQPSPRMPPAATVDWGDDETLRSAQFGDVYASRRGALEEARAVFLDGCGLPERWAGRGLFSIGELGFGAGLNALATWDLWRRTRAAGARLHFLSIEGFPLPRAAAARALSPFASVAPLAAQLLARWPVRAFGPQRFVFAEDGFILTVLQEDVETALAALDHPFDAWFLDGFAPAKNPAMWTETILSRIRALSAPGAQAATYSAAGVVRRGLEQAGFAVRKAPGFGGKRERLLAGLSGSAPGGAPAPRVAVIGGGIAGACAAGALAERGADVTLLTAGAAFADAASGNPAGLIMPRLDRGDSPGAALMRAGFLYALDFYRRVAPHAFQACGVVQRPDSPRAAQAFADLLRNPPWPEEHLRAGPQGGLAHGQAGMLDPRAAIAAITAGVPARLSTPVQGLRRGPSGWVLMGAQGAALLQAEAVVVATGAGLGRLPPLAWMPLQLSAGQIEYGPAPPLAHATTQGGYVGPIDGGIVFGATFAPTGDETAAVSEAARAENLARLEGLDPGLAAGLDRGRLTSRAAVRATTADRLPILGPAPEVAAWGESDADAGPRHEGLWILGGLGARGLTLAPLLAESLASRLCGEPDPLYPRWRQAVDPARFVIRALKRRERLGG